MLVNAVLMKLCYKKPPLSPPTLQKHHPFESTLGSGVLLPFVHQPIPTQDCTFLLATLPPACLRLSELVWGSKISYPKTHLHIFLSNGANYLGIPLL